jgi:hypothetical protein
MHQSGVRDLEFSVIEFREAKHIGRLSDGQRGAGGRADAHGAAAIIETQSSAHAIGLHNPVEVDQALGRGLPRL